jgi:hypothetical protein
MKGKPMKLSDALLIGRALNMLEKGRPMATWARVSRVGHGEIDWYVHALAGR